MRLAGLICSFPLLFSANCLIWPGNTGNTGNTRKCSYTTKRYDFELASDDVRKTYFDTFRKWALMTGPGSLHDFVEIHDLNEKTSHGVPCFLVWHRKFLKDAEDALRRINPNFVFLYWDWSRDHQKPHLAKVWDAKYLGTNGKGVDKIVRDGVMNNITCLWPKSRPHLLKRDFQNGDTLPPFTSPSIIKMNLDNCANFQEAWLILEGDIHLIPHGAIGGDKEPVNEFEDYGDATTMYSPNDPFFWMHHMFIDMLWFSWQKNYSKEKDYYGYKSELIRPWNARVGDYLDSEAYPVCATYDRNFLNQDLLPIINPKVTLNFFAKFKSFILLPIRMLTNIWLNTMDTIYDYSGIKYQGYSMVAGLIDLGEIPNFRVKSDTKNIPHPDIIVESPPLSDRLIKMNHMNKTKVREREAENAKMAQAINSQLAMENPEVLKWFEKMWKEES